MAVEAQDLTLTLNGKKLFEGDSVSIHMVFNNLTGKNFENTPKWKRVGYKDYLETMAEECNVEWEGDLKMLEGEEILGSHVF